jgi:hypothetical protein
MNNRIVRRGGMFILDRLREIQTREATVIAKPCQRTAK